MKASGLLGGMSWESTAHCNQLPNQGINEKPGRLHSAKIAMVRVDFQPPEKLERLGELTACGD